MTVVFLFRVSDGRDIHEREFGRAFLENGKIRATPPEFALWLAEQNGRHHKVNLDPKDGEKYLENLPLVFQNAYLRAVLEPDVKSPGGTRSGGAERK